MKGTYNPNTKGYDEKKKTIIERTVFQQVALETNIKHSNRRGKGKKKWKLKRDNMAE